MVNRGQQVSIRGDRSENALAVCGAVVARAGSEASRDLARWHRLRRVLSAFLILLCSCAASGNATEAQQRATDVALAAWEARFGRALACEESAQTLSWDVLPDVAAVKRRCGDPDVDACHLTTLDGSLIVVHAERGAYIAGAYAHELTHWLAHCSGRAVDGDDHPDDLFPGFDLPLARELAFLATP